MQYRFKFRVFGHSSKKMISILDLNVRDFYYGIFVDNRLLEHYFGKGLYTIMQCTGLKDENGKLIYEGDILKYTSKPTNTQKNNPEYKPYTEKYSVVWEDFYTGYNLRSKEKVNCFNLGIMTKDCEVIGNIYENPELLEKRN